MTTFISTAGKKLELAAPYDAYLEQLQHYRDLLDEAYPQLEAKPDDEALQLYIDGLAACISIHKTGLASVMSKLDVCTTWHRT